MPLLEQAIAASEPDGWFHEELAEAHAALGRDDEARKHATLALPLLERDDASLAADEPRSARLRELAR